MFSVNALYILLWSTKYSYTDHMCAAIAYKFLSWNTNGLNQLAKWRKVLSFLRKHKIDVVYLQESHLTDTEHCKLGKQWQGQIFYSSFTSLARGVAILVRKGIPFQAEQVEKDRGGRYILVLETKWSLCLTLMDQTKTTLISMWTSFLKLHAPPQSL